MFEALKEYIRQVLGRMTGSAVKQVVGTDIQVSERMEQALELWRAMYGNDAPWLGETVKSLNIPAALASEVARLVTLEAEIMVAGSARGDYLQEQLLPVYSRLRRYTEYACAMGGVVFKPYLSDGEIAVGCVMPEDFFPTAFDSKGKITGAVFLDRIYRGQVWYTRVERHGFVAGRYVIDNKAFRADTKQEVGREIPLDTIPEWAELTPHVEIDHLATPLFAYFKIPQANQVEPSSPLGVSVFSRAADLIQEADRQYSRMLWEFEGSELAIDASADLFQLNKRGEPILPKGKERLYRALDMDMTSDKIDGLQVFSPDIRDQSLVNGLDQLFRRIEYNCGLSYGTLSQVEETAKTATEIKTSKQRLYATVTDIQKSLEAALRDLADAMDALATLYRLVPPGSYEISCNWDDSIVVDADTERMQDKEDVRDGIMQAWEFRAKWYGEDEATAKSMVGAERTDDEYMRFGGGGG